jgi:hypothetical protein
LSDSADKGLGGLRYIREVRRKGKGEGRERKEEG